MFLVGAEPAATKDEALLNLVAEVTIEGSAGLSLHGGARGKITAHMRQVSKSLPDFQRAIETLYSYGKVMRTMGEATGSDTTLACAREIIGLCKSFYAMLKRERVGATQRRAAEAKAQFAAFCGDGAGVGFKKPKAGPRTSPLQLRISTLTGDV